MPATRTKERQPRDVAINLRANRRQRALIDRAAEALGKNRSDFMLEAACREANTVLVDRRFLLIDEKESAVHQHGVGLAARRLKHEVGAILAERLGGAIDQRPLAPVGAEVDCNITRLSLLRSCSGHGHASSAYLTHIHSSIHVVDTDESVRNPAQAGRSRKQSL